MEQYEYKMTNIIEPSKSTEVIAEADILVIGSGPAGLAAAVAATREGVSVILVERYGCFGGVISQVGVESIAWYRHEGTTDVEGIGIEFEKRAKALGGTQKEPQSLSEALNPEMFKYMADQLVQETGVNPLLHCLVVEPIMEGNTIKGEQLRATEAEILIAPCHNCHSGLEDIVRNHKLDMHVKFIIDLLYDAIQKPSAE